MGVKRPWSKWYWDHYHGDTRELSPASRGIWQDALRLCWIKAQEAGQHPGYWTFRVDSMPAALGASPTQVLDFLEEMATNRVGFLIYHGPTRPRDCDIEAHVTRMCCDTPPSVTGKGCDKGFTISAPAARFGKSAHRL